jgi:crotonobetainyl-CoA:carnitine CoA-transferase CaiB-like acyl-CoA transferase
MALSCPLPLAGLRVLDLTTVIVGPTCTWRLGQYGAEIVKVEAPEGDLLRGLGGQSPTGQHSGGYLHLNRGKRNICLYLKEPGASLVMDRLFGWADVVVANMRPNALRRFGIDPETVRAKYPDTIYCLLTGYGTDGPYAGRPTYDSVLQGAAGIAGLFRRVMACLRTCRSSSVITSLARLPLARFCPPSSNSEPAAAGPALKSRCSRPWLRSSCRSIWRNSRSSRR